MKKIIITLSVVLAVAVVAILLLVSIDDSTEQPEPQPAENSQEPSVGQPEFELNLKGLRSLEEPFIYELWVLRDGQTSSLGRFNVSLGGNDLTSEFKELNLNPANGDEILITLEKSSDTNGGPSDNVVLSGVVGENGHERVVLSFAPDLGQIEGSYILGTPTNDPEGFEMSGIWFVHPGGKQPSLNLPVAPSGWQYEGWVFHGDHYLSSGRFSNVSGLDNFDDYSDVHPGPNFPGEDYLRNLPQDFDQPLDLIDGESEILVSLEVNRANSATSDQQDSQPYVILLRADISQDAVAHTLYPLIFEENSLPSGYFMVTE